MKAPMNFIHIHNLDHLIKVANSKDLTEKDLANLIDTVLANKEITTAFVDSWRNYYKSGPFNKVMYKDMTESQLQSQIVETAMNEFKASKEEMGSTFAEQIHYLVGRALDPLDPSRFLYIGILKELGAEVTDGKIKLPPEWSEHVKKIDNLNKLFEWAYEQEYGIPFVRSYDMTQEEVNTIKNTILNKYKNLIGEPIPLEEKESTPLSDRTDKLRAMGKKDVIDPEYAVHPLDKEASKKLKSINIIDKKKLADLAQAIYNTWDASNETYGDFEVGFGGICHLIAEKIVDYLYSIGIPASTVSSDAEVHVYAVAQAQEGVFVIDIPPYSYETGGGYSWKKIPDIIFDEDYIVVNKIDPNPKSFEMYYDSF